MGSMDTTKQGQSSIFLLSGSKPVFEVADPAVQSSMGPPEAETSHRPVLKSWGGDRAISVDVWLCRGRFAAVFDRRKFVGDVALLELLHYLSSIAGSVQYTAVAECTSGLGGHGLGVGGELWQLEELLLISIAGVP